LKERRILGILALAVLLLPGAVRSASDNPENFRTRCGDSGSEPVCWGPGCQTCARSCHSSHFVNSGPGTLLVQGLPDPYVAGTQYPLSVVIDDAANADFAVGGFQVSVLALYDKDGDLTDELCQAGILESAGPETRVEQDAPTETEWLEHTAPQAPAGGQAIWNFLWTAPIEPVGMAIFNVCAVAADDDGTTAVDWVYCNEFRVPPEVLPCPRFSVTAGAAPTGGDCEALVTWDPEGNIDPTTWNVLVSADGGLFDPVPACTGLADVTECTDTAAQWGADLIYQVEGTDSCHEGPRTESDDTDMPIRVEDVLPPVFAAPAAGTAIVECDVTVTWDPGTAADACSGLAGYRIYRSDGTDTCPSGTLRGEAMDPAAASYPDTVPISGDYFYWVHAVDAAGHEEDNCLTAQAVVTDCTGTCNDFTMTVSAAAGAGDCSIQVTWDPDGNEGDTTYDVEYSRNGGPFRDVPDCTGLVNATTCTHIDLRWEDDYAYRVTGTDSCPLGPREVVDETADPVLMTDITPPTFDDPATRVSSTLCSVAVGWNRDSPADACSGLDGYRLYRSDGADTCPNGTLVRTLGNPRSGGALDTVDDIGEYWYWVHAVDEAGNEEDNCVTAQIIVTGCNVDEPIFPWGGVGRLEPAGFVTLAWTTTADAFNLYRGYLETVGVSVTAWGDYDQVGCSIPGNGATDPVIDDGEDYFYLVVPLLQGREQLYGCTDPDANGGCNRERESAADPCP